jgi:hypothetical protein
MPEARAALMVLVLFEWTQPPITGCAWPWKLDLNLMRLEFLPNRLVLARSEQRGPRASASVPHHGTTPRYGNNPARSAQAGGSR